MGMVKTMTKADRDALLEVHGLLAAALSCFRNLRSPGSTPLDIVDCSCTAQHDVLLARDALRSVLRRHGENFEEKRN